LGGMSGAPSVITLDDGSKPHPKSRSSVKPGQRITLLYAGGGGYGDPKLRDPDAVRADLRDGYISADAARRDYGLA
jgi:N-methylhydantoinase B